MSSEMQLFLLALAPGMRPAKIYNGNGLCRRRHFLTDGSGQVSTLSYPKFRPQVFAALTSHQNTQVWEGGP